MLDRARKVARKDSVNQLMRVLHNRYNTLSGTYGSSEKLILKELQELQRACNFLSAFLQAKNLD